jgi:predicted PurR-regulated permease PerM
MLDNPVAKRTAIAAAIGAVIANPVPFVGPVVGALAGAGYGYFTARQRG